jgi:hypothetical protein
MGETRYAGGSLFRSRSRSKRSEPAGALSRTRGASSRRGMRSTLIRGPLRAWRVLLAHIRSSARNASLLPLARNPTVEGWEPEWRGTTARSRTFTPDPRPSVSGFRGLTEEGRRPGRPVGVPCLPRTCRRSRPGRSCWWPCGPCRQSASTYDPRRSITGWPTMGAVFRRTLHATTPRCPFRDRMGVLPGARYPEGDSSTGAASRDGVPPRSVGHLGRGTDRRRRSWRAFASPAPLLANGADISQGGGGMRERTRRRLPSFFFGDDGRRRLSSLASSATVATCGTFGRGMPRSCAGLRQAGIVVRGWPRDICRATPMSQLVRHEATRLRTVRLRAHGRCKPAPCSRRPSSTGRSALGWWLGSGPSGQVRIVTAGHCPTAGMSRRDHGCRETADGRMGPPWSSSSRLDSALGDLVFFFFFLFFFI